MLQDRNIRVQNLILKLRRVTILSCTNNCIIDTSKDYTTDLS